MFSFRVTDRQLGTPALARLYSLKIYVSLVMECVRVRVRVDVRERETKKKKKNKRPVFASLLVGRCFHCLRTPVHLLLANRAVIVVVFQPVDDASLMISMLAGKLDLLVPVFVFILANCASRVGFILLARGPCTPVLDPSEFGDLVFGRCDFDIFQIAQPLITQVPVGHVVGIFPQGRLHRHFHLHVLDVLHHIHRRSQHTHQHLHHVWRTTAATIGGKEQKKRVR